MNKLCSLLTATAGAAVLFTSVQVTGQDWPQWRGPNRDGKVAGFTAPEKWPEALTAKWKTQVGLGDATPALVGDKLYVFARQGSEEVILCLNAADGKELWRDKYEAQAVNGPASGHGGPRSSPAVAKGKVVTLGVGGILSCLDAANGKVVWRKDNWTKTVPGFFTAMSPLITGDLCIVHMGGKGEGTVVALDLASGNSKWEWAGDGPAYASPVLFTVDGSQQVVVQTEKNVVGLGLADGKLLWQVASPAQRMAQNAVTPVVDGSTIYYSGQGQGTKAIKIEKQGDSFAAKELWANATLGTVFNTPVLKDGSLFGLSDKGNLFCINAQSGEATWTDSTKHDRFGAVIDAGSVVLALPGQDSTLIAFKPNNKQYEELAKIKVSDTPTYAHPLVAGHRMFVKDKENLTLFSLD